MNLPHVAEPSGELDTLSSAVMAQWHRFLDVFEPLRPELYRYSRYLTRSTWDAEDLVQDALMRGFVTLGTLFHEVPNPRAWLFRVASNLWIDRMRRARFEVAMEQPSWADTETHLPSDAETESLVEARAVREGAGTLLVRLAPQERAAVVLKDIFDFSLDEVAEILMTTPGAIKAALKRGRGKLLATDEPRPRAPAPGALTAFCEAFNARDLERLTALLLESSSVEIVGVVTEYGREAPKDSYTGSLAGTLSPISFDERGGVPPELLEGYLGRAPRAELRAYRDGWVLLFWYEHVQGPLVRTVMTVEVDGDHIARVKNYFFTPDVIAEVCAELSVPYHCNGYRYWHGRS